MKSTGVIRRIDELGRIVLPKEIRRNLGIREGENLEIFVEEDRVILKKYSKIKDYKDNIRIIGDLVTQVYDVNLMITDRDKIVYSNKNPHYEDSDLNIKFIELIHNRESVLKNELQTYKFNEEEKRGYYFIQPIISSIDCLGLIMLFSDKPIALENIFLLKLIALLIVKKVDIS